MIRAVVFDLDGTLVEFPLAHLFATARAVFADLGLAEISEAELAKDFADFDFFASIPSDKRAACAEHLSRELERIGHPLLQPFSDTRAVLQTLQSRGYRLAIATARVVPEEELKTSLEGIELAKYFECLQPRDPGSDDWQDKVPQLRAICARLRLHPEEICFVGDIPSDITSAQRCGVSCNIATLTGGIRGELLESCQPDAVIESLSGLLEILD